MAYCRSCGAEIVDRASVCPHCGTAQFAQQPSQPLQGAGAASAPGYDPNQLMVGGPVRVNGVDDGNFGWAVLGFFFPVVGLILYIVWKDEKPNSSRVVGRGAIASVIVGVILYIFFLLGLHLFSYRY